MSASDLGVVELISVKSEAGRRMLAECGVTAHAALQEHFVGQVALTWCSAASSVIVLNALRGDQSLDQPRFLDLANAVVQAENVGRCGMTLEELGHALRLHGAQVEVFHAESYELDHFRAVAESHELDHLRAVAESYEYDHFRDVATRNLARPDDFIVVNYLRDVIGQQRGGHFSPLAAYHAASDRFLILDVAAYKYEPVWVRADDLWRAMAAVDSVSGRSRGFMTIALPHCPVIFPR